MPDAQRAALLRHCLGVEGRRILATLTLADGTFDSLKTALGAHFCVEKSRRMYRFEFGQRQQRVGEPVAHFVSALRDLAKHCAYGQLEDGLILDQLIRSTSCDPLRERLLLEPDSMTLNDAIMIAKRVEMALAEKTKFARATAAAPVTPAPPVQNVAHGLGDDAEDDEESLDVQPVDRKVKKSRMCMNCGASEHTTGSQSCPARGKRCKKCDKLNHFARGCRSAATKSDCAAVPVNIVHSGGATFKYLTCDINGRPVKLLVDTGARVSILNKPTYEHLFSHVSLEPATTSLAGYGHSPIEVLGVARLLVKYKRQRAPHTAFHVTRHGSNIMGLPLFYALGFAMTDARGQHVLQVGTTQWPDRYPDIFEGLGCMKGFVHRPTVDPTVRPVIQPLRRIPLALRDGVEMELRRLQDAGVIEPVDASPWVSNLVIARKKGGGLRLCVDLTDVKSTQ